MQTTTQSLIWASAIIAAAIFCNWVGMSEGASFGVIAGLSGAAYGSIIAGSRSCQKVCRP